AVKAVEFDRSMRLPVEAIAASGARAFFLTSPNAPTGVAFTPEEIETVLQRFDGILVVDEAYAPFARRDCVGLLAKYPRLVITRTLSKAHALAGLRVGYALAHPEVIGLLDRARTSYNVDRPSQAPALAGLGVGYALAHAEVIGLLDRVRDSYNVNRLSQAAALAALADTGYYDAIIGKINETRDHWLAEWSARDWFAYESQANFIF